MKQVLLAARGEPVRAMGVVSAVGALLALFGVPAAVWAAFSGVLAALLAFPVRGIVTPVASAVQATRAAAQDAAAQVASRLDTETAGVAGTITDHAAQLVDTAAVAATDTALRNLGVRRKDRS